MCVYYEEVKAHIQHSTLTVTFLVLVVIMSMWKQVDYWCRIMMPWQEMNNGPSSPETSLLLDYVSPIHVSSLWTAAKNKHWVIVASTFGSLILKLAVSSFFENPLLMIP